LTRSQLILPKFIVPIRPQGQVLEGYGVLIEEGKIQDILPVRFAETANPGAEIIELPGHALLPGLINMHTHSPMTLLRGFADDLNLSDWLNDHIWPAESRHVGPKFVADGTRLAIAEMIRAGTTCFNDNYFFPDVMAGVVRESGIRALIGLPLLDQPSPWAGGFDEYLEKGIGVLEKFEGEDLIGFSLAPHAPYSVSDAGLQKVADVSKGRQQRVHLHCLETAFDVDHSQDQYGKRPLDRLSDLGLLNDSLIAVHMTQLEHHDFERLRESGVHVVHCPQSNMKLASGICPVPTLMEQGVNVSIGTDSAASNNNLDMLEEARFAALLAKGSSGDPTALNAVQALEMITINGAKALGLEAQAGSIETGKNADLCAINLDSAESQPIYNVFSQIIYAASSAQFTDVWVAGRRVLADGRLTSIEEGEVMASAAAWQRQIGANRTLGIAAG
jgi:5-methylthioadenosine/S-adenosylhomocysteine deaminase